MFNLEEKNIINPEMPEKHILSPRAMNRKKNAEYLRKQEAEKIISDIWPLKKGISHNLITNGQSNAGGFYEVIRDKWSHVEEVCIATWIMNRHYIDMLINDVDSGRTKKIILVLSNRMGQLTHHKPHFNRLKTEFSKRENIMFKVCNSHAKTYSMTNGEEFINVTGSGNWSRNPRIENYILSNCETSYNFNKEWMTKMTK